MKKIGAYLLFKNDTVHNADPLMELVILLSVKRARSQEESILFLELCNGNSSRLYIRVIILSQVCLAGQWAAGNWTFLH